MAFGREQDEGYIAEQIKKSCVYPKYIMPVAMASGYKYSYRLNHCLQIIYTPLLDLLLDSMARMLCISNNEGKALYL